jgi:hypothetical protein
MSRPSLPRIVLRVGLGMGYAFLLHGLIGGGNGRRGWPALGALLVPALTSAFLGVVFASTLRPGAEPMIARVARAMERDEIPPPILAWLRSVTLAWCCFFVLNFVVSGGLALFGPMTWWTLWNGLLAYLLMGALLLGEYVTRKIRFRWYRDGLLDRFWRRTFPPFATRGQGSGRSSDVT